MYDGFTFQCSCCRNNDEDLIVSIQELEYAKIARKFPGTPCYILQVSIHCGKCKIETSFRIPIERVEIESSTTEQ